MKVWGAVDLISRAKIQRQTWLHLPVIFEEGRPFVLNLLADSFLSRGVVLPRSFLRVFLTPNPVEGAGCVERSRHQIKHVCSICSRIRQLIRQTCQSVRQSRCVPAGAACGGRNYCAAVSGRTRKPKVDAHTKPVLSLRVAQRVRIVVKRRTAAAERGVVVDDVISEREIAG